MAQTILVTGGAGFIGSHVCEALLARGDRVVALDNFNDFYDPAIKRGNWAEVERVAAGRATLVTGDIRDARLVNELFAQHSFTGVIHLAAMAGVRPSLKDPLHYEDVNLRGTLTLLEAARQRRSVVAAVAIDDDDLVGPGHRAQAAFDDVRLVFGDDDHRQTQT